MSQWKLSATIDSELSASEHAKVMQHTQCQSLFSTPVSHATEILWTFENEDPISGIFRRLSELRRVMTLMDLSRSSITKINALMLD